MTSGQSKYKLELWEISYWAAGNLTNTTKILSKSYVKQQQNKDNNSYPEKVITQLENEIKTQRPCFFYSTSSSTNTLFFFKVFWRGVFYFFK